MRRLMVLLVLTAAAWAAQRAAVLTDISGPVFVIGPQGRAPATLLRVLDAGDQLELQAGARVSLAAFADGRTDIARGPCRLEIGAQKTRLTEGAPGALKSIPASGSRALVPKEENLERLGGSMMGYLDTKTVGVPPPMMMRVGVRFAAQQRFLSPPHFRMETFGPARLTLLDAGGRQLWSDKTASPRPTGPKLAPGRYVLRAADEEAFESELTFEIVSREEAAKVAAARREARSSLKARPDDLTPRLLMIGVYLDHGLLGEALDEAGQIERQGPEVRALVRSLNAQLWPLP